LVCGMMTDKFKKLLD